MKVRIASSLALCLLLLTSQVAAQEPPVVEQQPAQIKQIGLIIDDFGNDQAGTKEMLDLPISFTAAVMPFLPSTQKDAEQAHRLGHDVIVHMPMEPVSGKASWLGPGAITTKMSDAEVRAAVLAAIADVPHAVGMNNHMGSKVTADERVMRIVLQVCKEKNLFFVDSRTSAKSVVTKLGQEMGVRTVSNDMFLDDQYTRSHIAAQAVKLQKRLARHDQTVVIGHVGPPGKHTAAVLKQSIATLQKEGGQFVKVGTFAR